MCWVGVVLCVCYLKTPQSQLQCLNASLIDLSFHDRNVARCHSKCIAKLQCRPIHSFSRAYKSGSLIIGLVRINILVTCIFWQILLLIMLLFCTAAVTSDHELKPICVITHPLIFVKIIITVYYSIFEQHCFTELKRWLRLCMWLLRLNSIEW